MKIIQIERAVLYVSDIASLIGCSAKKVYDEIKLGRLKASKHGIAWIITVEDFEEYLKSKKHNTD